MAGLSAIKARAVGVLSSCALSVAMVLPSRSRSSALRSVRTTSSGGTVWARSRRRPLHSGERRLLAAIGAHHDDQSGAAAFLVLAQERQPVHVRHPHVAQHEVERLGDGALQRSALLPSAATS